MKVSVIVPTYNGVSKIFRIIKSLEEQTLKPCEVLIVIDGSSDNTFLALRNYKTNLKLKLFNQDNGGRSVSRNNGAKQAHGDILIFFDDDMRPVKNCLEEHLRHHLHKPGSVMVGSQIEDLNAITTDIQAYKAYMTRKWEKPLAVNDRLLNKKNLFLTAGNFSISKSLFFAMGGFDERLTDAEDFDLAVRLYKNKVAIYFNERAIGWHDDFITCKSYINRQIQYRKAHNLLKRLKPDLYQNFNMHQVNKLNPLKKFFFYFFSFSFWHYSIDRFNWLLIFPKFIRYKLYSYIITARSLYWNQ